MYNSKYFLTIKNSNVEDYRGFLMLKKIITTIGIITCFINPIYALCPNYCEYYVGNDKLESFNRKMFTFNSKLNKFIIKPVHIIWASIMPKYGIDRIHNACENIEYPKRLVSTLMQKDFKSAKNETVRFLTNSTIGLGGMYDPAQKLFKIKQVDEDMEQALTKCHMNSGTFLVVPCIPATNPRGLMGKALDIALNPTTYIATPVLAMVKAGLTVNKTSEIQTLAKMIESNYADPYDVTKKLYGIHTHIKCENLDRKEFLDTQIEMVHNNPETEIVETPQDSEILTATDITKENKNIDEILLKNYSDNNSKLLADEVLFDYTKQTPVIDSMKTALFNMPEVNKSIWSDLSIWNRSFAHRIKTSSVEIAPEREPYHFKYILQKDKTAPLAIIYPSIGEGINSSHSICFAKIFYDAGYSVIIQGSHFQWEFVKSMPKDYHPGLPDNDADYLKTVTHKIIDKLATKYEINPKNKLVFGTSFGAMETLFLASKEFYNNTLGDTKFIAVCPPVELIYAMKKVDDTSEFLSDDSIKTKAAVSAAKVLQLLQNNENNAAAELPFTDEEARLITGFIMHQKLSDLIFTIENNNKCKKCCDFYKDINNSNYSDYAEKYLLSNNYKTIDELSKPASLHYISQYLISGTNYKIYHSVNDYLTNEKQLKQLKQYSGKNTVLYDNGAHLGFLYRKEFLDALKNDICSSNK